MLSRWPCNGCDLDIEYAEGTTSMSYGISKKPRRRIVPNSSATNFTEAQTKNGPLNILSERCQTMSHCKIFTCLLVKTFQLDWVILWSLEILIWLICKVYMHMSLSPDINVPNKRKHRLPVILVVWMFVHYFLLWCKYNKIHKTVEWALIFLL